MNQLKEYTPSQNARRAREILTRLRAAIDRLGLNPYQLGQRMGRAKGAANNFLNGNSPSALMVFDAAYVLGLRLEYLYTGDGPMFVWDVAEDPSLPPRAAEALALCDRRWNDDTKRAFAAVAQQHGQDQDVGRWVSVGDALADVFVD